MKSGTGRGTLGMWHSLFDIHRRRLPWMYCVGHAGAGELRVRPVRLAGETTAVPVKDHSLTYKELSHSDGSKQHCQTTKRLYFKSKMKQQLLISPKTDLDRRTDITCRHRYINISAVCTRGIVQLFTGSCTVFRYGWHWQPLHNMCLNTNNPHNLWCT